MFRTPTLARNAAVALAGMLVAAPALACDPVHYLTFDVPDGGFVVLVNGAEIFDHDGGYAQGSISLTAGIVQGANTVSVAYTHGGGDPAGFSILKGCGESYPDETPLAQVATDVSEVVTLRFASAVATPALPSTDAFEITDGDGVIEALGQLQSAFRSGDLDTIYAMHAPFFARIEALGAPMDQIRSMIAYMVENTDLTVEAAPVVKAEDGGKVYRLSAADGQAPIRLFRQDGKRSERWDTGTRWVRIGGAWMVVDPN